MEAKAIKMEDGINNEVRKTIEKNGITKEYRVEQVENGYVVRLSESGYKGEGDDKEWYHNDQTFISASNPLEDKLDDEDKVIAGKAKMKAALDALDLNGM